MKSPQWHSFAGPVLRRVGAARHICNFASNIWPHMATQSGKQEAYAKRFPATVGTNPRGRGRAQALFVRGPAPRTRHRERSAIHTRTYPHTPKMTYMVAHAHKHRHVYPRAEAHTKESTQAHPNPSSQTGIPPFPKPIWI